MNGGIRLWVGVLILVCATGSWAGPEARYTALGANAICSEPLNNTDTPGQYNYVDASDSPDDSECGGNSGAIDNNVFEASVFDGGYQMSLAGSPDLDYGGTSPPDHVLRLTKSYVLLDEDGTVPSNTARWCMRWYERFEKDTLPPGGDSCEPLGNNLGKIVDYEATSGTEHQWWHQIPGTCPDGPPPTASDWRAADVALRKDGYDQAFGFSPSYSSNPSWSFAKVQANSSNENGWGRFETCMGGVLNSNGSRYIEARVTALDDMTVSGVKTPNFNSSVGAASMHFNSNIGDAYGQYSGGSNREIAYFLMAAWPTDEGQWIGAASEIEADSDGDGIPNVKDKCSSDSRNVGAADCDTDTDGYGNPCDGDFNQSNTTNSTDFTMFFAPDLGTSIDSGTGTDMNCSGAVNSSDYTMFFAPNLTQGTPGPSGLGCAGTMPCN